MDEVYENFVRQIAGEVLASSRTESLKDSVERDAKRQQLQKQIAALESKIHREKQLNVQMKLNGQLKKLKSALEGLK